MVFGSPCSRVGEKPPRGYGLRCQRRRPRAPLPPSRRWHDHGQTSSARAGGNPRSTDWAAAAPQRCSLLEGAAMAARGVPDAAALGWRCGALALLATQEVDIRGATYACADSSPTSSTPIPAGPFTPTASAHRGAMYVGLGTSGAEIVPGDVWQRRYCCPFAPSLDTSPFLAGGKAGETFCCCSL